MDYKDDNLWLMKGDCLERMKEIPDGSVDLTVTSPPYDSLREYEGENRPWCEETWRQALGEIFRVTKPGGTVVWIVGDATVKGSETGTSFKQALYAMEIGFNLHDTMIWNKGCFSAVGALKTRYAPVFEYMFVFTKGKIKKFYPIKDKPNKWAGNSRKHICNRQPDGSMTKSSGTLVKDFGQRYNIWEQSPQRQRGEGKHPAPFPEALASDHIISWSDEGDVVLDCFMGSGTTALACQLNNRKCIGIESVDSYFQMTLSRLGCKHEGKL